MTIYLRSVIDSRGDTVDLHWYCSRSCWLRSFEPDAEGPPSALDTEDPSGIEEGGAYPCGAESDSPDYCQTCGDPIGNPLTSEGVEYPADNPCARLDMLSALSEVCESREERDVLARLRARIRNGA